MGNSQSDLSLPVVVPISVSEANTRTTLDNVVARIKSAVAGKPLSSVELSFPDDHISWFTVVDFGWKGEIVCGSPMDFILKELEFHYEACYSDDKPYSIILEPKR